MPVLAAFALCAALFAVSDKDQNAEQRPDSEPAFVLRSNGLPSAGMWKCDPVFADLNHDGALDLVAIPRLGKGPRVWLNDGSGNWTESSSGLKRTAGQSCGGGIDVADVNNDDHPDLVVADHCAGVFVYLGDGNGRWNMTTDRLYAPELVERGTSPSMFRGAEDIAAGDINGDGAVDLVVGASDEGGINVFLGDGTGKNWQWVDDNLPKRDWTNRVELHDMNGDGKLDIVASFARGPRVWLHGDTINQWKTASKGLPSPMVHGLYTGLTAGDVNNDGRLDIAVANWVNGPEVFVQQNSGSWNKMDDVYPDMKGGAQGVALGDLNRDGQLDLAVTGRLNRNPGYSRGVHLLLGTPHGGWKPLGKTCGLPPTGLAMTPGVELADVNGDDVLDVAACSGLIVESTSGPKPKRTEPILEPHLIVWVTQNSTEASAPESDNSNATRDESTAQRPNATRSTKDRTTDSKKTSDEADSS